MEVEIFQHEWHGIPFESCAPGRDAIRAADPSFYRAIYDRLFEQGTPLDPEWVRAKLNLAEWIESTVFRPRVAEGSPHLSVLSLGVGLGVMEELWVQRGYDVSVQECQTSSLRQFVQSHPKVPVYIGDARRVDAPSAAFDVIVLSALDYVYDRCAYGELLRETARLLKGGGTAIMVTVSNLSVEGILRALAKRALLAVRGDLRARRVVRWGWKRTFSEHVRLGLRHGLRIEAVYAFDDQFRVRSPLRPTMARLIPARPAKLAALWRRA